MRKLLLIALFLFGSLAVSTQSLQKEDYSPIFVDIDGVAHYSDKSSLQVLKNGRRVFWAMHPYGNMLAFLSFEADCKNYRIRTRAFMFLRQDLQIMRVNAVSDWYRRGDPTPEKYLIFACN
jgi:hypothetical protein